MILCSDIVSLSLPPFSFLQLPLAELRKPLHPYPKMLLKIFLSLLYPGEFLNPVFLFPNPLNNMSNPEFFPSIKFYLFLKFIYLFIYLCLCWVFIAARGLSLVLENWGYSLLRCAGFSLWWLLLLQSMGSRRTGFISCGTQAQ